MNFVPLTIDPGPSGSSHCYINFKGQQHQIRVNILNGLKCPGGLGQMFTCLLNKGKVFPLSNMASCLLLQCKSFVFVCMCACVCVWRFPNSSLVVVNGNRPTPAAGARQLFAAVQMSWEKCRRWRWLHPFTCRLTEGISPAMETVSLVIFTSTSRRLNSLYRGNLLTVLSD